MVASIEESDRKLWGPDAGRVAAWLTHHGVTWIADTAWLFDLSTAQATALERVAALPTQIAADAIHPLWQEPVRFPLLRKDVLDLKLGEIERHDGLTEL